MDRRFQLLLIQKCTSMAGHPVLSPKYEVLFPSSLKDHHQTSCDPLLVERCMSLAGWGHRRVLFHHLRDHLHHTCSHLCPVLHLVKEERGPWLKRLQIVKDGSHRLQVTSKRWRSRIWHIGVQTWSALAMSTLSWTRLDWLFGQVDYGTGDYFGRFLALTRTVVTV